MTETVSSKMWVYVGTYTRREPHVDGKSAGIEVLRFDAETGSLERAHTVSGIENPTYLALHPDGTTLYAISEVGELDDKPAGGIYAYAIDADTHNLELINHRSVRGPGPAYTTIDAAGKNVLVANYGGGSVCVLPIQPDLSLGAASTFVQHEGSSVNPQRQEAPHAHSVVLDGADHYALVADLGLDKVMIYRYDAESGTISANPDQPWARTKSGAGPRHIAFHPSQQYVYVINELDSTIIAFRWDGSRGAMTEMQTISTIPAEWDGRNYTADIHVHPNGKFLYGSNRGHDSIAVFDISEETGELSNYRFVSSGGQYPRGFAIDPTGEYLLVANQNSSNIVVYTVDAETGDITPTGEALDVPTPVCVKIRP